MAFHYDEVVPWGRSFDEYRRMFRLSDEDLAKRILGCGDGPAGFNSELTRRGGRVVSVDPLYSLDVRQIRARIDETFDLVMSQTRREQHRFVWKEIPSVEALGEARMQAMEVFLGDFERGQQEGRYVARSLPDLSSVGTYDLALCSHLLFLYSEQLSESFHLEAIRAVLEIAPELRIFPVLDANANLSPHLAPVRGALHALGHRTERVEVAYEFQRGGNEMLVVYADGSARRRPADP